MMYNPRDAELYTEETDSWKQLYIKGVNAWIAAAVTLPATVVLDRIYILQQKMCNRSKAGGEESETIMMVRSGLEHTNLCVCLSGRSHHLPCSSWAFFAVLGECVY